MLWFVWLLEFVDYEAQKHKGALYMPITYIFRLTFKVALQYYMLGYLVLHVDAA